MPLKNPLKLKIFTGFLSLLLLSSFFLGCVNSDNTAPITVTIHSAYKTAEINGVTAKPGTLFLVVNMTIANHGGNDYTFNEKSVNITNGKLIDERLYTRLTEGWYWGAIPPNEQRTGDIIFGVNEKSKNFSLKFFYAKGEKSFTQDLGTVPRRGGSDPSATSSDTGDTATVLPAQSLNVTIHSAFKILEINGAKPYSGKIFVVVNMTIENTGDADYAFNETSVSINGGGPLTQKLYAQLKNPLHWGSIPSHEKITGEVVFSVMNTPAQYTVSFLDADKTVILRQEIGEVPERTVY